MTNTTDPLIDPPSLGEAVLAFLLLLALISAGFWYGRPDPSVKPRSYYVPVATEPHMK